VAEELLMINKDIPVMEAINVDPIIALSMIMDNCFRFFLIFRLLLYQSSTLLSTYSNLVPAGLRDSILNPKSGFFREARLGDRAGLHHLRNLVKQIFQTRKKRSENLSYL